jgi:hypothetical protein
MLTSIATFITLRIGTNVTISRAASWRRCTSSIIAFVIYRTELTVITRIVVIVYVLTSIETFITLRIGTLVTISSTGSWDRCTSPIRTVISSAVLAIVASISIIIRIRAAARYRANIVSAGITVVAVTILARLGPTVLVTIG